MEKIKVAQIGVCHEHASGKITSLRRLADVYEIVGVVDDNPTSKTPKFAGDNLKPYEGLNWMTEEEVLNYPVFRLLLWRSRTMNWFRPRCAAWSAVLPCTWTSLPERIRRSIKNSLTAARQRICRFRWDSCSGATRRFNSAFPRSGKN